MKHTKSIFAILVLFIFSAQATIYAGKPIPGVGIVVKKNPGTSIEKIVRTGTDGNFSIQLEEGEYSLLAPPDQLNKGVEEMIKTIDPTGNTKFEGEGIEISIKNDLIRVKGEPIKGNTYRLDKETSSIIISVPKGGAKLSGQLSWDGTVKGGNALKKGWDGSIKGPNKAIKEGGLK